MERENSPQPLHRPLVTLHAGLRRLASRLGVSFHGSDFDREVARSRVRHAPGAALALAVALFGLVVAGNAAGQAPLNTSLPAVNGVAQEGQTVTASPGTWTGTPPIAYSFEWRRCNAAGNACAAITTPPFGASVTTQTYLLTAADVGSTLRVLVGATNSVLSVGVTSTPSPVVTAASCTYTLNPTSESVSGTGGSGFSVSVTIPPSCITTGSFLAKSNVNWIHLVGGTPASGGQVQYVGSTVVYNVDANPASTTNTGTITIAGKTFTVTQGPSCAYTLNPTSESVSGTGGSGFSVSVTIPPSCITTGSFFAKSNNPWIHLVGGSPSSGGQVQYFGSTVVYNVDANPASTTNTGTITIAGKTFTVTRAGTGSPSANYQGLWYNSPAESESGWGLNLAHQGDTIFATWFTYDATGKAWWLSMTAVKTADKTYTGTLIQTGGPAFSAVPFNPAMVTRTTVGTGTLTFNGDGNNGSFTYSVNGVAQTKSIARQVFGPLPTCTFGMLPNFALATNYQDLWWVTAGAESGWGINVTHQGDTIFATWFTYDATGKAWWLSITATKTADKTYTGSLIQTGGPAFSAVPFNPALVTRTVVGTGTFTFANGNAATFVYSVNGVLQSKSITRQLFAPPAGTVCQ